MVEIINLEWVDSGSDGYCELCAPHVEGSPYPAGTAEVLPYHEFCNCHKKPITSQEDLAEVMAVIAERKEKRAQRAKNAVVVDGDDQRVTLAAVGSPLGGGFEVVLISAGPSRYGEFGRDVLAASLAAWEGANCFVDHDRVAPTRSVRDLAGVFHSIRWDDVRGAVVGLLRPAGPGADLVRALGREMLAEDVYPKPLVGFSADVMIQAAAGVVRSIGKVLSVDLVFNPARGGAYIRALNSLDSAAESRGEDVVMSDVITPVKAAANSDSLAAGGNNGAGGSVLAAQLAADVQAIRQLSDVQAERAQLAAEVEAARALRLQGCQYLLESGLGASKLPAPMVEHVRAQFAGKIFDPVELTTAIDGARKLVSSLTGPGTVAGVGQVRGMFNSDDQLEAAVDDLLGAPRRTELANVKVHRLRGIRDLYHMMTGDFDYHGGFYGDRVTLATTADFTGLVKNALNKMVVDSWTQLGRAGYDWWERVVTTEHFDTLNQITGTLVGTVGTLPVVEEGGEYTELVVGDSPETASFVKYGGYIPLTLELIDRDDTRKLRAYPRELANAGLRRISGLVAAVFTDNSAVGPTMADTGALFNATAVTTAGGHKNLLTTALAAAEWDVVATAVYDQPLLIKNATGYYGTGAKQAINPKFCLVPRALQLTAMQILYPTLERSSNIYSQNQQRGEPGDVVTVPEWTDGNNWAAVCDPRVAPAIYVGERFGLMPEIFIAGDERSPAVFSNDEHRMKVRHFCAVWVNDFRPLHKSNVA